MKKIKEKIYSTDKAINHSKNFVYFALFITFFTALLNILYSYYIFNQTSSNIYVIDDGGNISSAMKEDVKTRLEAEADNHLKMFYATFFTYDVTNVNENIKQGLELGGESVKELWKMYLNNNWYDRVKQTNLTVKSTVDSTFFDFNSKPYRARAYGHQIITNGVVTEKRNLNLDCILRTVGRIKGKNPHGLLIDKIVITANAKVNE